MLPGQNGTSTTPTGRIRAWSLPADAPGAPRPTPSSSSTARISPSGRSTAPAPTRINSRSHLEGRGRLVRGRAPAPAVCYTRDKFGDCQLHIEWSSPAEVARQQPGPRQQRRPAHEPLRDPGPRHATTTPPTPTAGPAPSTASGRRWSTPRASPASGTSTTSSSKAPRFERRERWSSRPIATVFYNGVVRPQPQRDDGPHGLPPGGQLHARPPRTRSMLQDHNNPVRYRNIWIRRLKGYDEPEK